MNNSKEKIEKLLYKTLLSYTFYIKIYESDSQYFFTKYQNVINVLNQHITEQLNFIDSITDKQIVNILIDLSDSMSLESEQMIETVSDCYYKIFEKNFNFEEEIKNEVDFIEDEINDIYIKIREDSNKQHIELYFTFLEKIQIILYRLIFQENINIPEKLKNFVYEYDRIDDEQVREKLYTDIINKGF